MWDRTLHGQGPSSEQPWNRRWEEKAALRWASWREQGTPQRGAQVWAADRTQHTAVPRDGSSEELIYLQAAIRALDQNISSAEHFEGQSFFNYNQFEESRPARLEISAMSLNNKITPTFSQRTKLFIKATNFWLLFKECNRILVLHIWWEHFLHKNLITQDKTFVAFPIRTDLIPYQLNPHFSIFLKKMIHWEYYSTATSLGRNEGRILWSISQHNSTHDLLMDTLTLKSSFSQWSS